MPRPQLVINLSGGVIRDVFCSVPGIQVLVVDWDIAMSVPGEPGIVNVPVGSDFELACVTDLAIEPLAQLAGTDTEAAIDAAYEQGVLCDNNELEASQAVA
jgi:hypothetical protein